MDIPLEAVVPNSKQPRRRFDSAALESLAASIRTYGLLQPIVVRPAGNSFELIAGERRWRAASLAGLDSVRAICRVTDDAGALAISVVENLQREDLNPIEEASAYKSMVDELALTHEQVAKYVGRERSTITNAVRLLELPRAIQAKLISGALSSGHARVLLAVDDPNLRDQLAERAAERGMSVRELERAVYGGGASSSPRGRKSKAAHVIDLERRISEHLGVRATVQEGARGGKLVLRFKSNQEFMRILDAMGLSSDEI
jgi:ParB family transcriptional regulator, chromosome partitioning protein